MLYVKINWYLYNTGVTDTEIYQTRPIQPRDFIGVKQYRWGKQEFYIFSHANPEHYFVLYTSKNYYKYTCTLTWNVPIRHG